MADFELLDRLQGKLSGQPSQIIYSIGHTQVSSSTSNANEFWMTLAFESALKAVGRTSPNPLVGCVIVKNGCLLAVGYHKKAGGLHAEVNALNTLSKSQARGSTLYVNLEPCCHTGRTGPCTQAIIAAQVSSVVVGCLDADPRNRGKGICQLKEAGIAVTVGVLKKRSRQLNESFLHSVSGKTNRPWVSAKLAQSLDGQIATDGGESKWITSKQARHAGRLLRGVHDLIAVGVETVLSDDPALTTRIRGLGNAKPVVFDSFARTPLTSTLVKNGGLRIFVGPQASASRIKKLHKAGAEIEVISKGNLIPNHDGSKNNLDTRVNITLALQKLHEEGYRSLLVEGGPTLIAGFADAAVIDKLHIFVASILIGGKQRSGRAWQATPAHLLDDALLLKNIRRYEFGQTQLTSGYPTWPTSSSVSTSRLLKDK